MEIEYGSDVISKAVARTPEAGNIRRQLRSYQYATYRQFGGSSWALKKMVVLGSN
jgi:hypothetical protein